MSRTNRGRAAIGLLPLTLCCCASEAYQETVDEQEQAIVGGSEAWLDSAVALATTQCDHAGDNELTCSGLLVSPTTVLTAAHCISNPNSSPACPNGIDPAQYATFRIAVGCHDIVTGCPQQNWITLAGPPVSYAENGDTRHDLAVLRLAQPVTVTPMRMTAPARVAEIKAGDMVTLYGWGYTAETGPASAVLNSVGRPILTIPYDLRGYPYEPGAFGTTSGQNPYVGPNYGDSGGPVLVRRDGEWFSLGVIKAGSYGSSGAEHVLVPYHFEWILTLASDFPPQSLLPSAQIMAVLG